jgi:hypothetical protein
MKKWISPFVFTAVFAFGSTASASELHATSPGITPDQLLYSVDQLLEDFQLYLTINPKKETEILLELEKERLAEAKAMTEEEKHEYINILMKNYVEKLALAEEQMAELMIEDKISEETVLEFETTTEEVTFINDEIEDVLGEDVLEQIKTQQASLNKLPTVVIDLDKKFISELRKEGLGFREIAQIYMLSEGSGKTVEEISSLCTTEKCFVEVAKELGLQPSE